MAPALEFGQRFPRCRRFGINFATDAKGVAILWLFCCGSQHA